MISPSERSTRYGVEIKPPILHVECEKLDQVLMLLEGHTGVVRVFDRDSHVLLVDGNVHDVRESLGQIVGPYHTTTPGVAQRAAGGSTTDDALRSRSAGIV